MSYDTVQRGLWAFKLLLINIRKKIRDIGLQTDMADLCCLCLFVISRQ